MILNFKIKFQPKIIHNVANCAAASGRLLKHLLAVVARSEQAKQSAEGFTRPTPGAFWIAASALPSRDDDGRVAVAGGHYDGEGTVTACGLLLATSTGSCP